MIARAQGVQFLICLLRISQRKILVTWLLVYRVVTVLVNLSPYASLRAYVRIGVTTAAVLMGLRW